MSIGGRALGKMHGPFVTALVCPRLHWMMWFEPYTVHIQENSRASGNKYCKGLGRSGKQST